MGKLRIVKVSVKEVDNEEARMLERILEDLIQLAVERKLSSLTHRKVSPKELLQTSGLLEHLDIKK